MAKRKISKGKVITELVKGSMQYTLDQMRSDFREQFSVRDSYGDMTCPFYIVDSFADYVVVSQWRNGELEPDEFYRVPYTYDAQTTEYTFAPQDQWEIVELSYQPQTKSVEQGMMGERKKEERGKKGKRIEERIAPGQVKLLEAKEENKGTRRIRIDDLMVADVVNGNNRLYSKDVIEAMVQDWQPYLRESRGQGRLMILSGEAEHPSDKGQKPQFLETVVKWDTLDWNGKNLNIEGDLILTSKGKDVETLMEAGVNPGGSIRGMGESKIEKVGGKKVEVVEWAMMNAADLVGDPSFVNTAGLQESQNQSSMEDEMNLLEELKKLLAEHPELFGKGMTEAQLAKMSEDALKRIDESIREKLGIDANADIAKVLTETVEKARKYDEAQKKSTIDTAITEATKELPYGEEGNAMFVEAVRSANPQDEKAVKSLVESKRKEYDKLFAGRKLEKMGFKPGTKIQGVQPVLEAETGVPEFARKAFELTESIRKLENRAKRTIELRAESPAEVFTRSLLERFDAMNKTQLIQEAETTSDLFLPYTFARTFIEEAYPNLVAANIFDVGTMETALSQLGFEYTTGESGYTGTVTDEVVTGGAEGVWYSLAHGFLTFDTVVVTSNPAGTSYVEGTDYVIDYANGKIKFLSAGAINTNDVLVDYAYTAIREGEMAPIQRVKSTTSYMNIQATAIRLADQISREAIVLGQSQTGWDAVARTMANLIKQLRRKIDNGLLYMAISAVKSVPNNSTDPWTVGTTQGDLDELVRLMGGASVIVANRFYDPTFNLMSVTRAEALSHWLGFARTGFPNAFLNAAGFAGMVNNKPIFASTEFPDSLAISGNRELVAHRVFQPLIVKGPYATYATSGDVTKLVAADQYYAEEWNTSVSPVAEKGAFVPLQEGS